MKEVKTPKKPLIYYGLIVLTVLLLFNMLITPMIAQRQVKEVEHGTSEEIANDPIARKQYLGDQFRM